MASPTKAAATVERAASFRGPMLAAAAILLVFFGGFGTWAVLVPLSGAAIAPAVVAPEGFRKTIQHLEGGIVSEIRVQEGSQVEAGDVIVVLDATRARADYNGLGRNWSPCSPAAAGFRPRRPARQLPCSPTIWSRRRHRTRMCGL